ncbi:MAG: glutamate-5-semialdehyde dehydrogenase, partial [Solirubrobacteraceae bacterium]|nr:glutamate-5-semialdehyde dehydrogenase [Solirubrobacteraceae bacterium]
MAIATRTVSEICLEARAAARALAALDTDTKDAALHAIADALIARSDEIVEANERDMEAGRAAGL